MSIILVASSLLPCTASASDLDHMPTVTTITPFIYDAIWNYSEGMAMVRVGSSMSGKYGFLDSEGFQIVPPVYDHVSDFSEGFAVVGFNGRYGFVNKLGDEIIPKEFDDARSFSGGLAAVKIEGMWGFINPSGELTIPAVYSEVGYSGFSDGLTAVRTGDMWGFIDTSGNEIVPPQYQGLLSGAPHNYYRFSEGLAAVSLGGKWGYISTSGEVVINFRFNTWVGDFSEGLAAVPSDNFKAGFIDPTGQMVIAPIYDEVYDFSEGLAAVVFDSQWGIIDKQGILMLLPQYYRINQFQEGLALVQKVGGMGYINTSGAEVIPCVFDRAGRFNTGLAYVGIGKWQEQKYGYINLQGDVVIPLVFDEAGDFVDGKAPVKVGDKYGVISLAPDMQTVNDGIAYITIGSGVVIKGSIVQPPPPVLPTVVAGRAMLPFRYLVQTLLGGEVDYDEESRTITATVSGHTVVMVVDSSTIKVDREDYDYGQAPVIQNGSTLVPLRAFEQIVSDIGWDQARQTVTIVP